MSTVQEVLALLAAQEAPLQLCPARQEAGEPQT
jgi:hypothetical protein